MDVVAIHTMAVLLTYWELERFQAPRLPLMQSKYRHALSSRLAAPKPTNLRHGFSDPADFSLSIR